MTSMSLTQLSRLLPLPEADLQQALDYANTLSKQEAADHFNNLLGESPHSIEFISSFNARRQDPTASASSPSRSAPSTQPNSSSGVPKPSRKTPKKKAPLHTPAPRQINDSYTTQGTVYQKRNEDDYVTKRPISTPASNNAFSLGTKPDTGLAPAPRAPPSAAGSLISDFKPPNKSSSSSRNPSRTASPAPVKAKTKVNITGGTSMHGASAALNELDAAIRTLEISTNSTLQDTQKRKCNCIGARHPLLAAAPNCLNCGKVICVKEGLGPCTFCGKLLLSAVEFQGMIRELREERGREKQAIDASSHRRAEVSKMPLPFSTAKDPALMMSPSEAKAKEHRDRLLGYQSQNEKRTTVRDEVADFDMPVAGVNMWASPAERAKQLKMQQRVLAEQEWNARPEYEKRRQVVSIDLVKGKVMKRMGAMEKPSFVESEGEDEQEVLPLSDTSGNSGGGTFSRNPLLGGLIKPVWKPAKGKGIDGEEVVGDEPRKMAWRRVQDDLDDNEEIILDGGALGGQSTDRDEPECG